jgi:hypothetical protein
MAQAECFPSVSAEDLFRIQENLCGIFGDNVALGQVYSPPTYTAILLSQYSSTRTPYSVLRPSIVDAA